MTSLKHIPSQKLPDIKASDLPRVYRVLRKEFGHQRWWPGETPLEIMIGAILTQNTAWTNVEKAIRNLKKAKKLSYPALCTISKKTLARLIRPAGYYNLKADRLKHFIDFLERECRGDLSQLREQSTAELRAKLLEVKGIGPETADSIVLYAFGKPSFVIDAYTKRIFSRHRLAPVSWEYHDWKRLFEKALPRKLELYNDFHAQIVKLAKDHCRREPRCEFCPLGRKKEAKLF